jgi:hypothetical protein
VFDSGLCDSGVTEPPQITWGCPATAPRYWGLFGHLRGGETTPLCFFILFYFKVLGFLFYFLLKKF